MIKLICIAVMAIFIGLIVLAIIQFVYKISSFLRIMKGRKK